MASKDTIKAHELISQGWNWDSVMALERFKGRTKEQIQPKISLAIRKGELAPLPKHKKVSKKMFDGIPGPKKTKPKIITFGTEREKGDWITLEDTIETIPKINDIPSQTEIRIWLEGQKDLPDYMRTFYHRCFADKKKPGNTDLRTTLEIITRMNLNINVHNP